MRMVLIGLLGGFALSIGIGLLLQTDDPGPRVWGALVMGLGIGLVVRAWIGAGRQ